MDSDRIGRLIFQLVCTNFYVDALAVLSFVYPSSNTRTVTAGLLNHESQLNVGRTWQPQLCSTTYKCAPQRKGKTFLADRYLVLELCVSSAAATPVLRPPYLVHIDTHGSLSKCYRLCTSQCAVVYDFNLVAGYCTLPVAPIQHICTSLLDLQCLREEDRKASQLVDFSNRPALKEFTLGTLCMLCLLNTSFLVEYT